MDFRCDAGWTGRIGVWQDPLEVAVVGVNGWGNAVLGARRLLHGVFSQAQSCINNVFVSRWVRHVRNPELGAG